MGLFGPDKAKLEQVAKLLDKEIEAFKSQDQNKELLLSIFDDPKNSDLLFRAIYDKNLADMEHWVKELRNAKNFEIGQFAVVEHSDVIANAWLMTRIEVLNRRVTQQHALMLELFDALANRSEKKIGELREKLKQMESKQLSEEQVEAVDAVLKGFKDSGWDLFGRK